MNDSLDLSIGDDIAVRAEYSGSCSPAISTQGRLTGENQLIGPFSLLNT
jgi:hypothetical protein